MIINKNINFIIKIKNNLKNKIFKINKLNKIKINKNIKKKLNLFKNPLKDKVGKVSLKLLTHKLIHLML
jgi:hypothetical protein